MKKRSPRRLLLSALLGCVVATSTLCFAAEQKPLARYAIGRVTFEDGKPITGDIQDFNITISGVSEAGEKVFYTPIVKNGAYRQRLVPGQFRSGPGTIKVKSGGMVFALELVPVGTNWDKSQDSADGIVQDFVWKPTGPRYTYGARPDPSNATHWHGMSITMLFQIYRSDTGKSPTPLPEGTKLVFTLKPTSRSIDGRELQPITVERDWQPNATHKATLNDLPPANYEITGLAKLPDGTTKPILLAAVAGNMAFVTKASASVEPYYNGGLASLMFGWVTE